MEYGVDFFNLPVTGHPGDWAAAREAEGWAALGVGDHITLQGQWALHAFPILGAMVGRTSTVKLATAFANNLVRSPVEFTQFAVTMQHLSNGRFEAGIGAGWASEYIEGSGMTYPAPPERARRYREAVLVIRELLNGGNTIQGEFYNAFNRTHFGTPNTTVTSTSFGRITGTFLGSREVQVSGRFTF